MPADITVAITQQGLNDILKKLTGKLTREMTIGTPFKGNCINTSFFQVFYSISANDVEFVWNRSTLTLDEPNKRINIKELDIMYKKLQVKFDFHIAGAIPNLFPTVSTINILPTTPSLRPAVRQVATVVPIDPRFRPPFSLTINLDGMRSEVSAGLSFEFKKYKFQDDLSDGNLLSENCRLFRQKIFNDDFGVAVQPGWEFNITSGFMKIHLLDTAHIIGDQFDIAIASLASSLPQDTARILTANGGSISKVIRSMLDWPEDVRDAFMKWLSENDSIVSIQEKISELFGFLYLIKIVDTVQIRLPNSEKIIQLNLKLNPEFEYNTDHELIFRLSL